MRDVLVLQHVGCETLGAIEGALTAAGFRARYVRAFLGESVPETLGDAAGLVVMGGPQSVYEQDQFPYLCAEMKLMERALKEQRPVLGTCLGSQLLAATLGANVRPGPRKEIGWYPLTLSAEAAGDALWHDVPQAFMGFHWHGDIFDLPSGALRLASSQLTENQAFRYGTNAYGFLFHMEVNEAMVREWVGNFSGELARAKIDGAEIVAGISEHLARLQQIGADVYSRWAKLLK
jgi:GMP synthase (glutamine-hydrolysing)